MNIAVGVLLLAIFAAWPLLLYAWADHRERRNSERIAVICHHLGIPLEDPPTRWQQMRAWWAERMQPVMAEVDPITEPIPVQRPEPEQLPTEPMAVTNPTPAVEAKRAQRWDQDAAEVAYQAELDAARKRWEQIETGKLEESA